MRCAPIRKRPRTHAKRSTRSAFFSSVPPATTRPEAAHVIPLPCCTHALSTTNQGLASDPPHRAPVRLREKSIGAKHSRQRRKPVLTGWYTAAAAGNGPLPAHEPERDTCRYFVQPPVGRTLKLDHLLRPFLSIRQNNPLLVFLLAKKTALK
jgi:hypothetical protein